MTPEGGAMRLFRRIAREPLVHFLLIGALLVVGLSVVKWIQRPVVRIDAQDLNQLAAYWEIQMQRPPNKQELAAIINDRIDEELLAREAMRLGLDKDDMIIRRRLAQKMSFATDDLTDAKTPDEATLRAYYQKTAARYAAPTRVSFQQAFYSGDRPHGGAAFAARQAIERIEDDGRDPKGDPFIFPLSYEDVGAQDMARDYGDAFAKLLQTAPVGQWSGPVISPYGWHIVRVTARHAPETVTFESVRAQVLAAYMDERRVEANQTFMARLRKRYRVVVSGVPGN